MSVLAQAFLTLVRSHLAFRSALLCADELLRRVFAERLFWPPVAPPSLPGAPESLYRFAPETVMSPEFWLPAAGEEENHE